MGGFSFAFAIATISNTKHLEHIGRGLIFDGAQSKIREREKKKLKKSEENKNLS
jgi:hypothetical protein